MTKSDEADGAIARAIAEFGRLDILVNNLGDSIRKLLVDGTDRISDEDLEFVMDVAAEHVGTGRGGLTL